MLQEKLNFHFDWQKWKSENSDLKVVSPSLAGRIIFNMFIVNEFENVLLDLEKEGLIRGPIHSSIGQEAIAAATIAALEKSDQINGTHRAHHLFLAKSMQYVLPDAWNPIEQDLPEAGYEVLRRTFAEIMGLAPGYCGGHGGSMHLRHGEAGFFGSNAVVGGGIPIATGVAFAQKYKKNQNLVISFLGDGATNQGTFHEACNLAAIWDLPIIFFIENNLYAEATTVENACGVKELSQRASAYGMDGYMVDGYDILAIYQLIKHIKAKRKPCIIEAKTYRHYDHTGKVWGSEVGYRSREEEEEWLGKDAISRFPDLLLEVGILTATEISRIKDIAISSVAKALDFCLTDETPRKIRSQLWPKPETVYNGLRSNGDEWQAIAFREREQFSDFGNILYTEAIATAITHWFQKSQDVFFIGEEVGSPGSILHSANPEFSQKYANQIFNTPISEAGFVGLSCGAAMSKLRPIVEIMYSNFSLVAADQLFAQIGKSRYLYGNTVDLPIVVRTKVTLGFGMGEHHSMNPVGLFALFPGWRIVVPSNAFDYIGLFNYAMQSLDPVLIVEFKSLYEQEFPVPDADLDYFIPLGKARIAEIGEDITIITYGSMVGRCQDLTKILATDGISVEIIDLRSLDFPSIDYDTIGKSLKKTRAVVIVEEAAASQGICKTIAANITEKFFSCLQSPVICITGKDVNPVSPALEALTNIQNREILEVVTSVAKRKKI